MTTSGRLFTVETECNVESGVLSVLYSFEKRGRHVRDRSRLDKASRALDP
jgi:hypothetical protein